MATGKVFDKSFDGTFTGPLQNSGSDFIKPASNCGGITLMWLTTLGWFFWNFEATKDTKFATKSVGVYQRDKLQKSTKKINTVSYLLRTGGLTENQSLQVSTCIGSNNVYWIQEYNGALKTTPVFVETTDIAVWQEIENAAYIELVISLPYTTSLRS